MVLNAAACLPDGAVALEAPAKAQLPDAVALVDAAGVLQISQYIPGQHEPLLGLHATGVSPTRVAVMLPQIYLESGGNMSDASMGSACWHIQQQSCKAWHE